MSGSREPSVATVLGLGSTTVVLVLGGTGLGFFLDDRFGLLPICTLVGLALGIAASWAYAYIHLRRFLRK